MLKIGNSYRTLLLKALFFLFVSVRWTTFPTHILFRFCIPFLYRRLFYFLLLKVFFPTKVHHFNINGRLEMRFYYLCGFILAFVVPACVFVMVCAINMGFYEILSRAVLRPGMYRARAVLNNNYAINGVNVSL